MADHPKDKPVKSRLQSAPGWVADSHARAQPQKAQPEPPRAAKAAPKTEKQPKPSPAAKPATAEKPVKPEARPTQHTTQHATQRLKPSTPAFKWPTLDLSAIKWPSWKPSWTLPSLKRPTFKAPSFPYLNKRTLSGAAAALAGASLVMLFARPAAHNSDADTTPEAQTPVAESITRTPAAAAPAAPVAEAPKAQAAKKQDTLSTITHLPQPGTATEQDVTRLMRDSKLPRDVIEEALHV